MPRQAVGNATIVLWDDMLVIPEQPIVLLAVLESMSPRQAVMAVASVLSVTMLA